MNSCCETEQQVPGQEWPFKPGPRAVKMHLEVPRAGVAANTGTMLVLHNWGGRYDEPHYVAWCRDFADRYNVVAVSVNYLQSRDGEPEAPGKFPYDHGYLQAVDVLRALKSVHDRLRASGLPWNSRRTYAMGVSGGGNVTLMANKLAPHTFACVVDICGMPGLTDGIAFGTGEWGSDLNAGYSRDPASPAFLTPAMQAIRDPGNPDHLVLQFRANPANKVVIVHGLDDASCPVVHKIAVFRNMVAAGFRPDGHFLTRWHIDGDAVTVTNHAVGGRLSTVHRFAGAYLGERGELALQTSAPNDFERGGQVRFPVPGGFHVVDYSGPLPSIRFEPSS